MKLAYLALLLLLLVPSVAAQEAGVDVRQYQALVFTSQTTNGVVAETNVSIDDFHTWDSLGGQSILEIQAAYTTQASAVQNPQADYRVLWNGSPVPDCEWHVQGGTISGGRFNPTISLYCLIPVFVTPGNHTIEVERTSVTGTPVINAVTSIILHQTESISMDLNIVNLEFWLPVLFWVGFLVAALWWDWQWTAAFAIPGLLQGLFPDQIPGDFSQYLLLAILGLILEYFKGRKSNR